MPEKTPLTDLDKATILKMQSIYRLYVRGGTDGEKGAASNALDRMCVKYNLDRVEVINYLELVDLIQDPKATYQRRSPKPEPEPSPVNYDYFKFVYKNVDERRILEACIAQVLKTEKFRRKKSRERAYYVWMEEKQYWRVNFTFEQAKARYRRDVERFAREAAADVRTRVGLGYFD